jgi:endonuclease-3 related protein
MSASKTSRPPSLPLAKAYTLLMEHWGPQHWWPGETDIEIIVGAILTQNTAWGNVEKAIRRLKEAKALTLAALHEAPQETLAEWIRPAGFFRIKARRIRAFTTMVFEQYGGSLKRLFNETTKTLRNVLLQVHGIGPETADSILLYVGHRPVFVVDAYTRRFLYRHGWIGENESYDRISALFRSQLPADETLFNEYHALIVALGKNYCRPRPKCDVCPLRSLLKPGGPQ